MKYAKKKPTAPGWYWCRNHGDRLGSIWEAITYVDRSKEGVLYCSWMTAPGSVGILFESEWDTNCLWAGPIKPPTLSPR